MRIAAIALVLIILCSVIPAMACTTTENTLFVTANFTVSNSSVVADMNTSDINITNMNTSDINITNMNTSDINITDMNTSDINVTDMNTSDINVTDMNT